VRVSADSRYTLYVNGVRIHQGPARCFPATQSYDTLDLAAHLHAGRNAICAIVHQFGVPTFQNVYRDACGFLLDGHIEAENDQKIALNTPVDWRHRIARGWRKDVSRLTIQMGFQEHFDADADPADWMSPDYESPESDGWAEPMSWPVGYHPWLVMSPREIPLLSQSEHSFASVICEFHGENGRGYKIADDVYHFACTEERKRGSDLINAADALLKRDESTATISPRSEGEFVAVVLDSGSYRTGHLQLDIAQAAGDEIIDILYAEELDKNKFPLIVGTSAETASSSQICTADRYRCRPGAQTWETFGYRGMKYVALIFRNITSPLKLRHVGVRQVQADVAELGKFHCSDEKLNQIWHVGRQTQRNCLFDAFVDCPWREQAMWWGDARVQARVTSHAFGDISILERGIRLMAQSQAADGSLHSHPPSDEPHHRLPDFMMTWVGSLWDHYFHSGKTHLIEDCLPALHRLMEFFQRHEIADGLMGNFQGWWVFLDWAELYKGNYCGVLNMMYLQALRYAAALCQIVSDSKSSALYSRRADALAAAIVKYFWDDEAKIWRDGFDAQSNEPVEQVSQHMSAMAILLGLKREQRNKLAREVLIKTARGRSRKIVEASPFFYAYVLEALIESGCRKEAVDIIRDKWGAMIDAGATTFWELWEVTTESRCHAWSSSPVYHLMQQVLGVMPAEPGWRSVRIAPLTDDLEFARGTIPSPHGLIHIEWEKAGEDQLACRIDLPPGIKAEFVTPLGDSRMLKTGMNEFHT
jgi:hypothetical protein